MNIRAPVANRIACLGFLLAGGSSFPANGVLTPMISDEGGFASSVASTAFLWRMTASIAAVIGFLIGLQGLLAAYVKERRSVLVAAVALALCGVTILFAHEWAQIFFIRELALVAAEALQKIEDQQGISNAFDLEAIVASAYVSLTLLFLSASMMVAERQMRISGALLLAGLLAIPVFGAAIPGSLGMVVGATVFSIGLIAVGLSAQRQSTPKQPYKE